MNSDPSRLLFVRRRRTNLLLLVFAFVVLASITTAICLRVLENPDVQSYDLVIEEVPFVVHAVDLTYKWNGREVSCTLMMPEAGYDRVAICEPRDVFQAKQWMMAAVVILSAACGGLLTRIFMSRPPK